MRPGLRARQVANLVNGSTLAGLGVAAAGRARLGRSADGLFTGTGYRLPVPSAPAFCLGNVIITRRDSVTPGSALFRHEARHATQYAWCGGLVMVPLYLAAAGGSWVLTGDFGARNVFERQAGLADGGYADRPLRAGIRRLSARHLSARYPSARQLSGSGRPGGGRWQPRPWPASAGRAGSTASSFRSAGTPRPRAARRFRS